MKLKMLLGLLVILMISGCDFGSSIWGGGGTGGQGLTGTIVDPQGVPVAGAKVLVYPEASLAKGPASPHEPMPDSTTTGSGGGFKFSNLASGRYNLEARVQRGDTTLVLFIRSIDFVKSLDLGADTLRIAGGLRASIRTSGNVPVVGATCSLFDRPWIAISDSSGTCAFSGLMPDTYRLRVASPGLIGTEIEVVVVSGGIADAGTVVLPAEGSDTTWTIRYQAPFTYFSAVAWSGSTLVAVGHQNAVGGFIVTSPDGINWTPRTSGTTQGLADIVWTGSQFLALGARGVVLLSPDGLEWTQHKVPDTTALLNAVAWSGTNFVIVGSEITLTSPDGVTWTAHEQEQGFTRVIWANSQFIAVDNSNSVFISLDGAVWTAREVHAGSHIQDVAWGNGLMVAVGSPDMLLTSTDGITWARISGVTDVSYSVEWVNGRFIVDGKLWSTDGEVWHQESHDWYYYPRVWTGTRMVVANNGGIATSP